MTRTQKSRSNWLKIFKWYQESVIYQCLGWIRLGGRYPFDDRVKDLRGRPLGMLFYNQRAIFFLMALGFLVILWICVVLSQPTADMLLTVKALSACWFIAAVLTVSLHPIFKRKLARWANSPAPNEYPPMFDLYFFLDWIFVFALIEWARYNSLPLDAFTFLLFANTIVYSTYIKDNRSILRIILVAVSLIVIASLLYPGIGVAELEPKWFYAILYLGPILGTLVASVGLVMGISLLRVSDQQVTQRRLELLGEYENLLTRPILLPDISEAPRISDRSPDLDFEAQVTTALESLCSLGSQSWYDSACLWLLEHHEGRGDVLVPGPRANLDNVKDYQAGVPLKDWQWPSDSLTMIPSLKHYPRTPAKPFTLRPEMDAPAVVVPISSGDQFEGFLTIYGKEGGPPLQRQEEAFLNSLGSLFSNSIEQWRRRYQTYAQMEMDKLFKLENLTDVFRRTAMIMQRYLMAAGCMVIFRPDPDKDEMRVTAWEGFTDHILANKYRVGEGLTGKCAKIGETIRCDDVPHNKHLFDRKLLINLKRAHHNEILSWMAVPIGDKTENYGVIKVVNRTSRCPWFTNQDQKLGEALAFALKVIVEKFLQIEMLEKANVAARNNAEALSREKKKAEETAARRQQDLMVITHQLQAPLSSVIGALTSLRTESLPKFIDNKLSYVESLVEDGLTLCYGTTTSFVIDTGKKTHFDEADVDAPFELENLCRRLQLTNARHDLNFSYHKDKDFPTLRVDRDVFTSVMYSLIHNAMKYSDEFSQVSLMCKFVDSKPVLEVSSKGEPILATEAEEIFEQFKRGRTVEQTGRHHRGVGLGLWVAKKLLVEIGGNLTVILPPKTPRLSIFVVHFPEVDKH